MSIWSRIFGKQNKSQQENAVIRSAEHSKKHEHAEAPRDIDLNSIEYIPLPPSPKTWEVDGRDEFHQEFENPDLKEIFQAGWQRKHTKVIKLAAALTSEQLAGQVGEIVAKAYRATILKRSKSNQLKPAARWGAEMLDIVPVHCTDVDKRRYNNILGKLNKTKVKHQFERIDVPSINSQPPFTISEGSSWTLSEVKSLSKSERPDTAFTAMAFTADGVLYADKNGKSELSSGGSPAALRKFDRSGSIMAEKALKHGIYRFGCSPAGSYCAIMNEDGNVYIYNDSLSLVTERELQNDKRVIRHFKTTETNYWGDFKSQIRAVDISANGELNLFTLADEAWCCSKNGDTIWGVRMPLNEGWVRAVGRSERAGLGAEIESALKILKLTLPVTPKEIKKQYRVLAQQHHPDLNLDDPNAHQHMQKINEAFQILTGVDPEMIDIEVEASDVTFFRRTSPDHVFDVGAFKFEITITGGYAQDWIYEASFSSHGGGAFLATYSGKVVEIDGAGVPMRIYDVGTVPSEIVDAGNYLYILTSTRLYVMEGRDSLVALVDVFRQGRLLVTTTGFGLLDSKSFQWFTPSGTKVGEVITCHPIRALYDSGDGAILETRQHRAVIGGLRLS